MSTESKRPRGAQGPEEHGGVGYWRRGLGRLEGAVWAAEEHDRLYGREAARQSAEDSENYLIWCSMEEFWTQFNAGHYRTESEGYVKDGD